MESDIVDELLFIRGSSIEYRDRIFSVKRKIVDNILILLPEIQDIDFFKSFNPGFYGSIFDFTKYRNRVELCSRLFVKGVFDFDGLTDCLREKIICNSRFPFVTYCPICKRFVDGSEYLYNEVFKDDYFSYWIANLVKHYRHEHIRYYDLSWSNPRYGEKNPEYQKHSHDEYRIIVNNRAKRQLIRKLFKDENLTLFGKRRLTESVLNLQHNDDKTVETVKRYLEKIDKLEKKSKL